MKKISVSVFIIVVTVIFDSYLFPFAVEELRIGGRLFTVLENSIRFVFLFFFVKLLFQFLAWFYRNKKKIEIPKTDNFLLGLDNLFYLIASIGAILTLLSFWGIDVKTLFTTLSIVAAAISIISKDYITEIIGGILIAFSGSISIDDTVLIGTQKGKVMNMTLTKITLLNDDDDIIFLSNNKVYNSDIINYTKNEIKKVSIDFEIKLDKINTIEELERSLTSELAEFKDHIETDSYYLKTVQLTQDSLSLKFQYVLLKTNRELEKSIRKKTVRKVINYIKKSSPGL